MTESFDRSSAAIHVGQLQSLLRAQVELHEEAQRQWHSARQGLIRLLETTSPKEMDRRLVGGTGLQGLSAEKLIEMLEAQISTRNSEEGGPRSSDVAIPDVASPKEEGPLKSEIRILSDKVATLEARAETLQTDLLASRDQVKFLLEERKRLLRENNHPVGIVLPEREKEGRGPQDSAADQSGQNQRKGAAVEEEPDWLAEWRKQETYERDKHIVLLLGETGLCRRPAVEAALARQLGVKETTRSLRMLFGRAQDGGLIEVSRPWKEMGMGDSAKLPDILRLTERGRLAFCLVAGRPPAEADLDRLTAKYASPEKALLALAAADMLGGAGYSRLEDGSEGGAGDDCAGADLIVQGRHGERLLIAVEPASQDASGWETIDGKWLNLHQLTQGNLHVVCQNRECMRAVRNQINHALGARAASIHLTNLADLQAGRRGDGGSIWLEVKAQPALGVAGVA
jgi:hypothetical protein